MASPARDRSSAPADLRALAAGARSDAAVGGAPGDPGRHRRRNREFGRDDDRRTRLRPAHESRDLRRRDSPGHRSWPVVGVCRQRRAQISAERRGPDRANRPAPRGLDTPAVPQARLRPARARNDRGAAAPSQSDALPLRERLQSYRCRGRGSKPATPTASMRGWRARSSPRRTHCPSRSATRWSSRRSSG